MLGNLIDGTEINIDVAREKLFTLYDLEWQDSISTKPKLRVYEKFKVTFLLKIMFHKILINTKDRFWPN